MDNNNNNMMYPEVRFRVVPFGPPITRDNECNNPGRQLYTSTATHSYFDREAFSFFWLDEYQTINQRTDWQSGPPINSSLSDFFTDGCGYWTSPGGLNTWWENLKGAGDPHKIAGVSMLSTNEYENYLYSCGIGQSSTDNEGMEYGVIGMSGYFKPDWDTKGENTKSYANIGLKHAYNVYRCDATDDDFGDFDVIKDVIFGGMGDMFTVGRSLFPDYMTGSFSVDEETRKPTGYTVSFPENFNIREYLEDNLIDVTKIFTSSGLLDKLRSRRFPKTVNTEYVLDMINEIINISFNKSRGVTGAHNFQLDPSSLSQRMKEKSTFSFLDLLNWYIEVNIVQNVQNMMPADFDISNYFNMGSNSRTNISSSQITLASRAQELGGELKLNDDTGEWELILPEGVYNLEKITQAYANQPVIYASGGQPKMLGIGVPSLNHANGMKTAALPSINGSAPPWATYNTIPTYDLNAVNWTNNQYPDRLQIVNHGTSTLYVYGSNSATTVTTGQGNTQTGQSAWVQIATVNRGQKKWMVLKESNGTVKANRRYIRVAKNVSKYNSPNTGYVLDENSDPNDFIVMPSGKMAFNPWDEGLSDYEFAAENMPPPEQQPGYESQCNYQAAKPYRTPYRFQRPKVYWAPRTGRDAEPNWRKASNIDTFDFFDFTGGVATQFIKTSSPAENEYGISLWWNDNPNAVNGWKQYVSMEPGEKHQGSELDGDFRPPARYLRISAWGHRVDENQWYENCDTNRRAYICFCPGNYPPDIVTLTDGIPDGWNNCPDNCDTDNNNGNNNNNNNTNENISCTLPLRGARVLPSSNAAGLRNDYPYPTWNDFGNVTRYDLSDATYAINIRSGADNTESVRLVWSATGAPVTNNTQFNYASTLIAPGQTKENIARNGDFLYLITSERNQSNWKPNGKNQCFQVYDTNGDNYVQEPPTRDPNAKKCKTDYDVAKLYPGETRKVIGGTSTYVPNTTRFREVSYYDLGDQRDIRIGYNDDDIESAGTNTDISKIRVFGCTNPRDTSTYNESTTISKGKAKNYTVRNRYLVLATVAQAQGTNGAFQPDGCPTCFRVSTKLQDRNFIQIKV